MLYIQPIFEKAEFFLEKQIKMCSTAGVRARYVAARAGNLCRYHLSQHATARVYDVPTVRNRKIKFLIFIPSMTEFVSVTRTFVTSQHRAYIII